MNNITLGIVGIGTQANPPLIRVIPPNRLAPSLADRQPSMNPNNPCIPFNNSDTIDLVFSGVSICDGSGTLNGAYQIPYLGGGGGYGGLECDWGGQIGDAGQYYASVQYSTNPSDPIDFPFWSITVSGPGASYFRAFETFASSGLGPFDNANAGDCMTGPAGVNGQVTIGFSP